MKVQAGQTVQPDPEPIVNPLQVVVVPALIGIMDPVLAEVPVLIIAAVAVGLLPILHLAVPRLPEDAVAAGLILVHAPVNKPRHKGVITYQLQVAQADGTLILLSALAANQQLAEPVADLLHHPAVLVLPAITG